MKISDLYESKKEDFDSQVTQEVMDVLVAYSVTGVGETNINNVASDLQKANISIDLETLVDIIETIGYTVDGDNIKFPDSAVTDSEDLSDEDEFDEVSSMAKKATEKRM